MTFLGISSQYWYLALILAVVFERLLEMLITRRNTRRLLARGGHPVGDAHFPWMVLLHAGLLIAAPAEVFWLERPFHLWLAGAMTLALVSTMALRYWAITTLGDRWTTRVLVVPGELPITGGPYRFLRHPNYLAVIIEVAALPLIHGAWLTALVVSVGNFLVLRTRIRVEEQALEDAAGYRQHFGNRPGLL